MSWVRVLSCSAWLVCLGAISAEEPERRVLLNDARWLVIENTYPPGSESALHTHRWPRTVYVLEGGAIELIGADGTARIVEAAAGQTMSRPPETHRVRNAGGTRIRVLETEAKTPPRLATYAFTGGRWFDGDKFVERTLYSVDGMFTEERPANIDEIVDLGGLYVVPPFGDAHAHHFDSRGLFSQINSNYLAEGIFYAVSMTNGIKGKQSVLPQVLRPDTIDIAYADAGVTATLGHPIMVYETLARGGYDFDRTKVERARQPKANEDAYFIVDNEDDLDRTWDRVLASRPDLVKIYLLYSEEYATRRDWSDTYGDRGLNPALVPAIVERARRSGVRLAAHVETAADFRVAVAAGVDIIAHHPGYSPDQEIPLERYRLTAADARLAAEQGTIVVPTPLSSATQRYAEKDPEFLTVVRELHRTNIGALNDAGVPLAIGTDAYFSSASRDAFLLHELGLFSNLELLCMWSVTTPAMAFPDRLITQLEPGYEASFVALRADPLSDFAAVKDIAYRFKQGRPIPAPEQPGSKQ